jgi:hypothetical protein
MNGSPHQAEVLAEVLPAFAALGAEPFRLEGWRLDRLQRDNTRLTNFEFLISEKQDSKERKHDRNG